MIVYVAGPYRALTKEGIGANIARAREIAVDLWEQGHVALCPHLNTAHFETDCLVEDDVYLNGDLQLLARCDAIVMTPNYTESSGAMAEREFALARGIPLYVYPELPKHHPTEIKRPIQVAAFVDTIMKMYRVHLDKNADYSPANIMGTGEIGLVTRLWDKMARLMNLTGFQIEISSSSYDKPTNPMNESTDDTYLDLANYGVISDIYRRGAWGK